MKPNSNRRSRRRQPSSPDVGQHEQRKDQRFFGPENHVPFFPPAAVQRAALGEDKREDKREENGREETARGPEGKKAEERKEEKVSRAAAPEEKKEPEGKISARSEAGQQASRGDEAGEGTLRYVRDIEGKGEPLPAKEREFFGGKMGFDFGSVRIHTGDEAAASARDASAKAYTYRNHVVFNDNRYAPGSHEGRRLLAHELAHVAQQGAAPAPGKAVHRQPGATAKPAPAPTATDPAAFQARLSQALSEMTIPIVAENTLSGALEPVLREMAANAEWHDASGKSTGGADIPVRISKARAVRLRLILDDTDHPPLTGQFNSAGAESGTLRIYTREIGNADASGLAMTLYHESLHLMRWLARNAPKGDLVAETGATGGKKATLENVDPAHHERDLKEVRRRVEQVAASVNVARPETDKVGPAGIDRAADFVLEEYLARIETEVFRLMQQSYLTSHTRHPDWHTGDGGNFFFTSADLYTYLFTVNPVFKPGDLAGLAGYDHWPIKNLFDYLHDRMAMFVRTRYSETLHGPEFP